MRTARTSGSYENIWTSRDKCVFCDLRAKYVIHEEAGMVLTTSLYPYIDGQLLIIPKQHVRAVRELTTSQLEAVSRLNYIARKLIRKVHGIKATCLLVREGGKASGASVKDHLHFHVIPMDSKDLVEWNYRELANTPLENAKAYKSQARYVSKLAQRHAQKYQIPKADRIGLVVQAIFLNSAGAVMLQERNPEAKLSGDFYSLPGGHVDAASNNLELELAREVEEEVGIKPHPDQFELVDSRLDSLHYSLRSDYLDNVEISHSERIILNTYLFKGPKGIFKKAKPLAESEKLHWFTQSDMVDSPRVSEPLKEIITKVQSHHQK